MIEKGHSRPMHSVPVPINVRCYSNNDVIVRRGNVTQRARTDFSDCGGAESPTWTWPRFAKW